MLFRRSRHRRTRWALRHCPECHSGAACPTGWQEHDRAHWRIDLRCGNCGLRWDIVIDNWRAARYDVELDEDMATIRRAVQRLDLDRMAVDADTLAAALEHDLIEPADFAA